ncbi:endonuclease V isoform X7 [Leptonychotes weddellii]|uniref:Endonuclease V isoform X7 n=1 Tax=Leptonychotes weddellii TaxID=9713 RepID=A0A7F8Q570_LEPWE|nr:endonuclease V isoform X7 [Leptonychotes weddellii]
MESARKRRTSVKYAELIRLLTLPGGRRHLPPQPDNCEIGAEGCVPGQAGSPSPVFPVLSPPTGLCLPGKIRRVLVCSLSTPSLDYLAHCPTSPASLSAPAGFGVACHLGVLTDLPCVGVAKKLLQVDGLENDAQHKEKIRLLRAGGDSFPLIGGSGTVLGMVLKSHKHSSKPLYVSVGHKISLEAAVRLTRGCCRFRIPEPVRQADIRSRDYIRRTLGVPGPPAPGQERSQKVQRPKVCPQEGSEEPEGEGRPPEAHS